jgi:predicted TIM-barrel fold metal-dependent hydrolase
VKIMMTRRELLAGLAASPFPKGAAANPPFERIDTHIHLNRPSPEILAGFRQTRWRALTICDSRAIGDQPRDLDEQVRGAILLHRESKGLISWATSFDPRPFERPDFVQTTIAGLSEHFKEGAIAVKIWKNVGMAIRAKSGAYLMPDNPALLPIYDMIQREGKTLVAHLAEPDGAWLPLDAKNPEVRYYSGHRDWYQYGRKGAPKKEEILMARDRVIAKYPKLRVVGCHLGSNESDLPALAKRLDTYPNFAVDVAARVRYLVAGDHRAVREFLDRYQDRITYGTDFVWRTQTEEQAWHSVQTAHDRDWNFFAQGGEMDYNGRKTQGLALPEKLLHKIFYDNPVRWFPGIA